MQTSEEFKDYLLALLPEEYPISSIPLSLTMTEAHRKELIFQQSKFLEVAQSHIESHPWLSYLAALKHVRMLEANETHSTTFREFSDKEYFDRVQAHCASILNTSKSLLDETTQRNCDRIIHIQCLHADIAATADAVTSAIANGIDAFEPPRDAPIQNVGWVGCFTVALLAIGIAIIGFAIHAIQKAEKGHLEYIAYFIAYLLVLYLGASGLAALLSPQGQKEEEEKRLYDLFNRLREKYYNYSSSLRDSLLFNSEALARDLPKTKQVITGFSEELDVLIQTYILPYT